MIFGGIMELIPLVLRFDIGDDDIVAALKEDARKLTSDKSAATGDEDTFFHLCYRGKGVIAGESDMNPAVQMKVCQPGHDWKSVFA